MNESATSTFCGNDVRTERSRPQDAGLGSSRADRRDKYNNYVSRAEPGHCIPTIETLQTPATICGETQMSGAFANDPRHSNLPNHSVHPRHKSGHYGRDS